MFTKIGTTIGLILFLHHISTAQFHSNGYAPGRYPIDSVEYEKICDPKVAPDFYSVSAKNNKSSYQILHEWVSVFKKPANFTQSGFLTIRFIVNCKSEPICFNIYEMDAAYQKTDFDADVKKQLIAFIKKMGGWKQVEYEGKPSNYFYYLHFNITKGNFISVSP
jgi:hypothetical protein